MGDPSRGVAVQLFAHFSTNFREYALRHRRLLFSPFASLPTHPLSSDLLWNRVPVLVIPANTHFFGDQLSKFHLDLLGKLCVPDLVDAWHFGEPLCDVGLFGRAGEHLRIWVDQSGKRLPHIYQCPSKLHFCGHSYLFATKYALYFKQAQQICIGSLAGLSGVNQPALYLGHKITFYRNKRSFQKETSQH